MPFPFLVDRLFFKTIFVKLTPDTKTEKYSTGSGRTGHLLMQAAEFFGI